jgi:hypothetical protein
MAVVPAAAGIEYAVSSQLNTKCLVGSSFRWDDAEHVDATARDWRGPISRSG